MKVEQLLRENGVPFTVHEHPPAYTAQEIAAEEHVTGNMIAKAVIVKADDNFAMCVLPASYKLDMKKVAKALKAKKTRLADEPEMAKIFTDTEVGAEPPFGNIYHLPTVADNHLAEYEEIIFQAGSHRQAIRMRFEDYKNLAKPEMADLGVHL